MRFYYDGKLVFSAANVTNTVADGHGLFLGADGFGIRNVVFRHVTVNGKDIETCGRQERGRVGRIVCE